MDPRRILQVRLAARAVTAAAGLALLVTPFLAWTSVSLQQLALLAVTTNGTLERLSLSRTGWEASAGTAAALTALALIVVATAVLDRLPLILPAGLLCLGALVLVVVQAGSPPSALPGHLGAGLPSSGVSPHSSAGAGETMAIAALVAAGLGMWGMLAAAHSERRWRRRRGRQRATVSTVRPPTPAVPASAGEPADGSA